MQKSKNAFTMVELIFVIVVLGILAAIAVPKLAATRDDAHISKGRADVASIRSGIVTERQNRLITGDSTWITSLGSGFSGVLMYPIAYGTGNGHWSAGAGTTYIYTVMGAANTFTYTSADGKFLCTSGTYCSKLTD